MTGRIRIAGVAVVVAVIALMGMGVLTLSGGPVSADSPDDVHDCAGLQPISLTVPTTAAGTNIASVASTSASGLCSIALIAQTAQNHTGASDAYASTCVVTATPNVDTKLVITVHTVGECPAPVQLRTTRSGPPSNVTPHGWLTGRATSYVIFDPWATAAGGNVETGNRTTYRYNGQFSTLVSSTFSKDDRYSAFKFTFKNKTTGAQPYPEGVWANWESKYSWYGNPNSDTIKIDNKVLGLGNGGYHCYVSLTVPSNIRYSYSTYCY